MSLNIHKLKWLNENEALYQDYLAFEEWIVHLDEDSFDNFTQLVQLSEEQQ